MVYSAVFFKHFKVMYNSFFTTLYVAGVMSILILSVKNLRPRELKWLNQDHSVENGRARVQA